MSFGAKFLLGLSVFSVLPWDLRWHFMWLVTMLLWSTIYAWRVQRLKPAIVRQQLCFNCGYSLVHTPTDEDGLGRCPECAQEFVRAQYERPE